MGFELPVVQLDSGLRERADAARNRAKILSAAEELFAVRGVEQVSMDDVARAACVGKGTLYRRFGDRAGLAYALLDEREREFQEQLIRGAPPLGPGAPARERLIAYGERYVDLLEMHGDLILAAEYGSKPGQRYRSSPYAFYSTHVRLLLEEAAPELDAEWTAHMLLAAMSASFHTHLRALGMDADRRKAGWRALVERLVP